MLIRPYCPQAYSSICDGSPGADQAQPPEGQTTSNEKFSAKYSFIMATATVNQYGWATPEDWETHRQNITNLYYHQNKKLKEVKVIMEQQYHFFAT